MSQSDQLTTSPDEAATLLASSQALDPPERQEPTRRQQVKSTAFRLGIVWALLILVIAAPFLYSGFFAWGNLSQLLIQNAPVALIALGMTFVMITGGFDLSVGAICGAGGVFFAEMAAHNVPIPLALGLTLVLGLVLGAINGFLIARLHVSAFVATLGTASIFDGAAYLYEHSAPIVVSRPGFETLGQGSLLGVSITIWILAAAFIGGGIVLARSVYGQSLYAVGGNREASRLAGLRVELLRASTYALVGVAAALGGAILASRSGVGEAGIGDSLTLQAIAIVVIGGTSLAGGEGAVWRTAVGVLILGIITNIANSRGWSTNIEDIITGAIVIGAVAMDARVRMRRR